MVEFSGDTESEKNSKQIGLDTSSSSSQILLEHANAFPQAKQSIKSKNTGSPEAEQIRVLTFNIAVDGQFGLDGVIDLIKKSNADVIGLQEAGENTKKIAEALGYNYM